MTPIDDHTQSSPGKDSDKDPKADERPKEEDEAPSSNEYDHWSDILRMPVNKDGQFDPYSGH
jgi:hypothetical protein